MNLLPSKPERAGRIVNGAILHRTSQALVAIG